MLAFGTCLVVMTLAQAVIFYEVGPLWLYLPTICSVVYPTWFMALLGFFSHTNTYIYDALVILGVPFMGLVGPIIVAPIVEEFQTRGILLWMRYRKVGFPLFIVSNLIIATIFALAHLSAGPLNMISIFSMAIGSGVLVWKTGRLLPSMMLHGAYNMFVSYCLFASF